MNIKVFISYVWEQSDFTDILVNLIGRDIAVLDKYSFERASLLEKEIEEQIKLCPIVVSLLSYDALHAPYIEMELQIIQRLISEGTIKHYKPFLLGDKITVDDVKLKYPWIVNYQLERTNAPIFVDRLISQFITELKWKVNPSLKARDNAVMVRLDDLARIRAGYYTSNSADKKAIIISGFPSGIGRTRLLREFLLIDIAPTKPKTYNPPILQLKSGESIEGFITFLNDWVLQYNKEELLDILSKTKEEKVFITIQLMNDIANKNEKIFIKDEDCIILANGTLNTWIKEIINSKELCNQLHLFVASDHFLNRSEKDNETNIINLIIQPLSQQEKTILFSAYSNGRDTKLSSTQTNRFLQKLPGLPETIFNLVDMIKDESIDYAENNLEKVIRSADEKIKLLLTQFASQDYVDLLILLSNFPNTTFKILNEISQNIIIDIDKKLQDLYCYSLIERYGSNNQYIAVNKVVSDYLERYKINLSTQNSIRLKTNLIKYFESQDDDNSFDLTNFVYDTEARIKSNPKGVNSKYLIPSIVIKLIREEYRLKHDTEVEILCKRFLEEKKENTYPEVLREITFWMCQAMARSSNDDFFDWIEDFDNASKHFLLGFYFRYSNRLDKAKSAYEKALNYANRNVSSEKMKTRIRQELVIILQKLELFEEALELAEENYEQYPTNTYYIVAYFRSLVRDKKRKPDVNLLYRLMKELNESFDPHKESFAIIQEGEYEYYINGDFEKTVKIFEEGIAANKSRRASIFSSLFEICKRQEAVQIANNIKTKYKIFLNE